MRKTKIVSFIVVIGLVVYLSAAEKISTMPESQLDANQTTGSQPDNLAQNSIENRINQLEKRVSSLESQVKRLRYRPTRDEKELSEEEQLKDQLRERKRFQRVELKEQKRLMDLERNAAKKTEMEKIKADQTRKNLELRGRDSTWK